MFKGKAKLNLGQDNQVNAKQNYDFSRMNMATATSKSNKPKEGEQEQEQFNTGGERIQHQKRRHQKQEAE